MRYCADNPSVQMGGVTISLSSRAASGGVLDNKITMRPQDAKKVFAHAQIAAFLDRLEAGSNQLKVTDLRDSFLGRCIEDDTIPAEVWIFEPTITNRIKDPSKFKLNRSGS